MSQTRSWAGLLVVYAVLLGGAPARGQADLTIDLGRPGPAVSPTLYGVFVEEVNHGVDGGLYAELVRNRGFEHARPPEGYTYRDGAWRNAGGWDPGFRVEPGSLPYWTQRLAPDAQATLTLSEQQPLSTAQSYHARWQIGDPGAGAALVNEGYWGMGLRAGERYTLTLWARTEGFRGPLSAWLETAAGEVISDVARLRLSGAADWQQTGATLRARTTAGDGRLVLAAGSPGLLCLDLVSLLPQRTFAGRRNGARADIAGLIADLRPAFMRFPGGCILEGATLESAWDWRDTVGPVVDRREVYGVWNQRRTHGFGLFDYLTFAEDLRAWPMYVNFAGQTCIYRERNHTPLVEMPELTQSMVELVEYITGDARTPQGARRAAEGRRRPFDLGWFQIGNENHGPEYEERYRLAYVALKAKYPDLTTISDYLIPDAINEIVDHHYYQTPRWFMDAFTYYDNYPRTDPPVYVGEYAVTSDCGTGNLRAALAEAVFALGLERNADVIAMASYAPLLGHVSGKNWNPILINFDSLRAYGTPSYYVQKMLAGARPDQMVTTNLRTTSGPPPPVTGAIGLGTWLTSAAYRNVTVERDGEVLWRDDFAGGTAGWRPAHGTWRTVGDELRQDSLDEGCVSFAGDENWHDYTLRLQARRTGGSEGFLIAFGSRGGQRLWWNLGGWGNREHGVELDRMTLGRREPGTIELDHWYDIRVELEGRRIRCYLDDALIHDLVVPADDGLWAVAGTRDEGRELIVKAVNATIQPQTLSLDLLGATLPARARLEVLTSANLDDENSLDDPTRVSPREETVELDPAQPRVTLDPQSFTVVRVDLR